MTMNEQFKDPHVLADRIFMEILPAKGMTVRENQIKLCHAMLDAMMHHNIALCDAGTGIGKTYSYLVAGLIKSRYEDMKSPVLISTSSIALQNAIINEYIPFLSDALTEYGIIDKPLRAVVRKGKNRYVCDRRLSERLRGIDHSKKNRQQRNALISLTQTIDLDSAVDLSEFDKVRVHVENCSKCRYSECRYRSFIKQSKSPAYDFQICNHNLLIADTLHRHEGLRPVLPGYCALIIDEAHKLPDAVDQMFRTELEPDLISFLLDGLRDEGFLIARSRLQKAFAPLKACLSAISFEDEIRTVRFPNTAKQQHLLNTMKEESSTVCTVLNRELSRDLSFKLNSLVEKLTTLSNLSEAQIRYAERCEDGSTKLCAAPLNAENNMRKLLWDTSDSAVFTSGTLSVGSDFSRFEDAVGLNGCKSRIDESVYSSPFDYRRNCLLYIPNERICMDRSEPDVYYDALAKKILSLINATHGHTLVLFTSYTAMSEVHARLLKQDLSVALFAMRRLSDGAIEQFKASGNGVLLGTGSMWEGMDFPGDLVSSLIIPRLPFAVPDALSEAKRNGFLCLKDYLERVVVPDMQIKLRQGFGRAIRTEADSCVISILDERAASGQRYNGAVKAALPDMPVTSCISEVARFIWRHKPEEYFLEDIR